MIITKKISGAIVLTHDNGEKESLNRYFATLKIASPNEILIRQTQGIIASIFLSGLKTQIEPALPTDWVGTASELVDYLADNFFF